PLEEVRALLFVMNARAIDEALDSYRRLNVDLCWATGFTVSELVPVHRDVVHSTDYDVILNISDDCVVTQEALDAVLAQFAAGYPAATGWCRLNTDSELVNLCHEPLRGNIPRLRNYSFYRRDEVVNWPDEIVPTHLMGMSLKGLRRELWREFPYDCYRHR